MHGFLAGRATGDEQGQGDEGQLKNSHEGLRISSGGGRFDGHFSVVDPMVTQFIFQVTEGEFFKAEVLFGVTVGDGDEVGIFRPQIGNRQLFCRLCHLFQRRDKGFTHIESDSVKAKKVPFWKINP